MRTYTKKQNINGVDYLITYQEVEDKYNPYVFYTNELKRVRI